MTKLDAEYFISKAKAWIKADNERMENRPPYCPRFAWRKENPIEEPDSFEFGKYALSFAQNGNPYNLQIWETDHERKETVLVGRINLKSAGANLSLARYTKAPVKFAFMDTNAGFFQGSYVANTLADAIKLYASDAGLISENNLSLLYAEITDEQEAHLNEWADCGFANDDSTLAEKLDAVQWSSLSDSEIRKALGCQDEQ